MTCKAPKMDTVLVSLKEAKRFMVQCMEAVGTSKANAEIFGEIQTQIDCKGRFGHGMSQLEMYVNDVKNGICDGNASPKILQDGTVTAWVDGQNGLGAVVSDFCMKLVTKKAKNNGIGWVSTKGSNHFGIGEVYTERSLKQGLLSMCFSNASPLMVPTRCKEVALGSNPMSLAAPAEKGDSYLFDIATTAVALEKIAMHMHRGQQIPVGWALDECGKDTTDAAVAYKSGRLLPLGGTEMNSGYKGFALAMMVEIFCGILAGSQFGPLIPSRGKDLRPADLGQCFIAVDPKRFAPGFEGRLSQLLNHIRNMAPADPTKPMVVAGDIEKMNMEKVDKEGGIRYLKKQIEACERLAHSLKVAPIQPVS